MVHLAGVGWKPKGRPEPAVAFPFDVPTIRALTTLEFTAPVTFFVGENGSGKSTLLEAIALAAGLPTVGARDLARDETLAAQRRLAHSLRLVWTRRPTRGFFLRAEDFFGYVQRQRRRARRARSRDSLA
jgi:predicted ATPase